jgi:hypothetical protein
MPERAQELPPSLKLPLKKGAKPLILQVDSKAGGALDWERGE